MQHDTAKTLHEIHGSVRNLISAINDIEKVALNRTKKVHGAIPLRFLTPLVPQPKGERNEVHLRLTPLHELTTDSTYVAVSYTWEQPKDLESKFKNIIPTYKIYSTDPTPRPPKCPPVVLYCALTFAQKKLGIPLIWIDQECILQDNDGDVEQHLQVMHEIYRKSHGTAVVLSRTIHEPGLLDFLGPQKKQAARPQTVPSINLFQRWARLLLVLEHLVPDPWFSRTWCFQERYCAGPCSYIVPIDPQLARERGGAPMVLLSARHLDDFSKAVEQMGITESTRIVDHRETVIRLANLIDDKFLASTSNLRRKLVTYSSDSQSKFYDDVFRGMENCDNSIVADRVAIFANLCNFSWTLNSTSLRNERYSYSTCLLVLLRMNLHKGLKLRDDSSLKHMMDRTIGEILHLSCRDEPTSGPRLMY